MMCKNHHPNCPFNKKRKTRTQKPKSALRRNPKVNLSQVWNQVEMECNNENTMVPQMTSPPPRSRVTTPEEYDNWVNEAIEERMKSNVGLKPLKDLSNIHQLDNHPLRLCNDIQNNDQRNDSKSFCLYPVWKMLTSCNGETSSAQGPQGQGQVVLESEPCCCAVWNDLTEDGGRRQLGQTVPNTLSKIVNKLIDKM